MTQRAWVLVCPPHVVASAQCLLDAHAATRPVRVVTEECADAAALGELADDAAAILVVGPGGRSARTSVDGPFLTAADGRLVPIGWLPTGGRGLGLSTAFAAAAEVATRASPPGVSVAVLGQWVPRYLHLADRMEFYLSAPGERELHVARWTAERIIRDDLVDALGLGVGVGVYFGHGRPSGWAAYHGLRSAHFGSGQPMGALLSMTCYTASRWGVSASFAESVVLRGATAAAVGAVGPVEHLENTSWMIGLAAALRDGHGDLGSALVAAAPVDPARFATYRIIGDPTASLAGSMNAWTQAQDVYAPAPTEVVAVG